MKIQKKIINLYSVVFIIIFVIIFSLNFIYKKYVIDLKIGNEYKVSAFQYYDFKSSALKKLFLQVFLEEENMNEIYKGKIYQIRNEKINEFSLTLSNPKTFLSFDLTTKEFYNEKDLEEKINTIYLGSIRNVINEIEDNYHLFDFEDAKKQSIDNEKLLINQAFNRLISSEFFAKYPPKVKCIYKTKEICLSLYSNYYNSIYTRLNRGEVTTNFIKKLTNIEDNADGVEIFNILNDFNENRPLYDFPFIDHESNNLNQQFFNFKKKYEKLLNSDFFLKYLPSNYCSIYAEGCFEEISTYYNDILIKHKREVEFPFNVIMVNKKKSFNFLKEIPLVFGITAFCTYILFILTNKFFKRKIK